MVDRFLLVDETHGVYVPQRFTKIYDPVAWGIEPHDPDWVCVQNGPEDEYYWDSWEELCDKAFLHDAENNKTWYLYNDEGAVYGISYRVNEHTEIVDNNCYFY